MISYSYVKVYVTTANVCLELVNSTWQPSKIEKALLVDGGSGAPGGTQLTGILVIKRYTSNHKYGWTKNLKLGSTSTLEHLEIWEKKCQDDLPLEWSCNFCRQGARGGLPRAQAPKGPRATVSSCGNPIHTSPLNRPPSWACRACWLSTSFSWSNSHLNRVFQCSTTNLPHKNC